MKKLIEKLDHITLGKKKTKNSSKNRTYCIYTAKKVQNKVLEHDSRSKKIFEMSVSYKN